MDLELIISEVSKVIKGKERVIKNALVCFLSGGHLLIEDIPGTGKTMLSLALAKVLGLSFTRIQFTSDLMPSDITGVNIFNPKTREFEFKPGPIFHNIVLADEINRGTPKTQSALLEAMAEKQVSIDGQTYKLPEPFFVIATQNPIEHHGTYPLPEAQLDRFTMKLSIGYPSKEYEIQIVQGTNPMEEVKNLRPLFRRDELLTTLEEVKNVYISPEVAEFIVNISNEIRNHPSVILGISTRGVIHLANTSRALALIRERDFVVPEDIIELLPYVVSHRIVLRDDVSFSELMNKIMEKVPIP
ncbi:MAG TPA: MoxR family ATPase [Aquifex aeolicus]|nr:MoxR family ATPase [Aquifex aeolicus]